MVINEHIYPISLTWAEFDTRSILETSTANLNPVFLRDQLPYQGKRIQFVL